ncbi:MAG: tetratricopeptide repeat-containing sensor histidine kinase [Flavobacteriaceae bacterium]
MLTNIQTYTLLCAIFCTFCYGQKTSSKDSLYIHTEELIEHNQAEEALTISLQQIENTPNNSKQKAKWLQLAGIIFKKNNELDTSLKYFKKSYRINQQNQDSIALMLNHLYIGQIFHSKFNILYDKRFSKKATQLKDSAGFYYLKNINEFKNVQDGFIHIGTAHSNLSFIYSDLDELNLAKKHINKAISIYKNNDILNKNVINSALLNLGLIYIYQEDYKLAEETHQNLLSRIKDTSNIISLEVYQSALGNLSYIYKKTNQQKKAYEYLEKAYEIAPIINQKKNAIEIRRIEAVHNADKARAEEAIKTKKQREAKQRTQYALAGTGMVSLIIILVGTVLYRNSKLKAKTLSLTLVEQELKQQKTLRYIEERNQNKLLNATLDGREQERKDIAQTLHDSVSALLSSANMHLQVAKKKSTSSVEELEKSQRIIDEASGKVRDLSHKLISAVLLKFGLEHAVYDLCEKYSNSSLEFELESEDKIPRFEQNFEIKIHNIIEECMNNIIKHSKASEASVKLTLHNNTLDVVVKDNGVGFNASKITPNSGIGLSQIKARIENMGGEFHIQSSTNSGTEITFKTPIMGIKV